MKNRKLYRASVEGVGFDYVVADGIEDAARRFPKVHKIEWMGSVEVLPERAALGETDANG